VRASARGTRCCDHRGVDHRDVIHRGGHTDDDADWDEASVVVVPPVSHRGGRYHLGSVGVAPVRGASGEEDASMTGSSSKSEDVSEEGMVAVVMM